MLIDGVPIDADIAPLITALWKSGIDTLNSCQDNGPDHQVWIEFATAYDASRFLNAVIGRFGNDRTVYGRAMGTAMDTPDAWTYAVFPHNFGIDEQIIDDELVERRIGPNDVDFSISIRFPRRDFAPILRRLEPALQPTSFAKATPRCGFESSLVVFGSGYLLPQVSTAPRALGYMEDSGLPLLPLHPHRAANEPSAAV